jgi:RNase H-like domain found in reverse transcriptase/Reverse transcriptase (RNA-dependent DNA polymerase)/Integrase zinc binding domain/Retroviral aspartyl protease
MQVSGKRNRSRPIGVHPAPGLGSPKELDHQPKITSLTAKYLHPSNPYLNLFHCSAINSIDKRPHLLVSIYGHLFKGLLDSGADCTVLGEHGLDIIQNLNLASQPVHGIVKTADGARHSIRAKCDLPFVYGKTCQLVTTLIVPTFPRTIILGINFWKKFEIEPTIDGKKIIYCDSGNDTREIGEIQWDEDIEPEPLSQTDLTDEQEQSLQEVIGMFPASLENKIGLTSLLKHKISTNGQYPPKQRFYPVSPAILKEMDKEIDRMVKLGVIEKSESPSSNPLVVARKPNGKIRLCLDSRKLNEITVKDAFPLPLINDILGRLNGTTFLSSVDLKDAFWQIELEEDARAKTAFTVPGRGLFQFRRMPFGLCNAAQSLSRLMHHVIGNDLEPDVFTYLDDIVIATNSFETHVERLRQVAERLNAAGLTISVEKSKFCVKSLRYLGFLIDQNGLHPDPEKISAIIDYPRPKNIREIRRFLGMTGWYHRFIPKYAELACPLTDLLNSKHKVEWSDEAESSFNSLRTCLVSAPILSTPEFDRPFVIQCDASDRALGAVLTQGEGANERVIAFLSKKFTGPQRKYAATEKECLAVLVAVKKFRQYVEGTHFKVITDCAALKWLARFNDATNGRLCRWALQLQSYDFEIVHRKGKNNLVPDALSRIEEVQVDGSISLVDQGETWLSKIRDDLEVENRKDWKEEGGKIFKRIFDIQRPDLQWKLAVDENERSAVLSQCHDAPTAGHMGYLKTLRRVQETHYWPGMSKDVRSYVKSCGTRSRWRRCE